MLKKSAGPYVLMALFCEKILREQDEVLSLIRVVDKVTHTTREPKLPSGFVFPPLMLVLSLRPGDVRGEHKVHIRSRLRDESETDGLYFPMIFDSDRGITIACTIAIAPKGIDAHGTEWFDVYFDEHLITSIPLEIEIRRIQTS